MLSASSSVHYRLLAPRTIQFHIVAVRTWYKLRDRRAFGVSFAICGMSTPTINQSINQIRQHTFPPVHIHPTEASRSLRPATPDASGSVLHLIILRPHTPRNHTIHSPSATGTHTNLCPLSSPQFCSGTRHTDALGTRAVRFMAAAPVLCPTSFSSSNIDHLGHKMLVQFVLVAADQNAFFVNKLGEKLLISSHSLTGIYKTTHVSPICSRMFNFSHV